MENIMSGSIAIAAYEEEMDESLEMLMQDAQFEQDLLNCFNNQMYVIKSDAPNPLWTLCSITMRMIRVLPRTEIIPVDEWNFKFKQEENLIECLVGTNLIKIPKKYVERGDWH